MRVSKILLSFIFLSIFAFAQEKILMDVGLNNQFITMADKSYKVLEFTKRIKTIKVSDSVKLSVDFIDSKNKPLSLLKVFAADVGKANALITFYDNTTMHVNFNIVNDIKAIINMIETRYKGSKLDQIGDNILLTGEVETTKEKKKIYEILEKAKIDTEKNVIDTLEVAKPEKMIRIKLYAVEINNTKGVTLKNNWLVSSKNYTQVVDEDGLYSNISLDRAGSNNAQRSISVHDAVDGIMKQAVSLTGGLTGAANYLGKWFNVGWTLQYLKTKGVARVLDETTLITTEGNTAEFQSGGYVTVKAATTSAEGVPVTELREINYGLKLNFEVAEIFKDEFMNLKIETEQSDADWANTVDGIPSIKKKSVKTDVVALDKATIIIGGLVERTQGQTISKIPLLGDIPILGKLFTSEDFQNGHSELAFFVTPEVVDTTKNSQFDTLNKIKNDINALTDEYDEKKQKEKEEAEKKAKEAEKQKAKGTKKNSESTLSLHEQRMKEMGLL